MIRGVARARPKQCDGCTAFFGSADLLRRIFERFLRKQGLELGYMGVLCLSREACGAGCCSKSHNGWAAAIPSIFVYASASWLSTFWTLAGTTQHQAINNRFAATHIAALLAHKTALQL